MKRLFIILLFLPVFSIAQEYTKIVEVPGKSVDKLYVTAREWFAMAFKSANNVLQMDDPVAGKLIGKGSTLIDETFTAGLAKIPYTIHFNVDFAVIVSLKESKYKCDIVDIFIAPSFSDGSSTVKKSYTELLSQKEYFKNGSDPDWLVEHGSPTGQRIGRMLAKTTAEANKCYLKFFDDFDSKINGIMNSLEVKMKKQEDNW